MPGPDTPRRVTMADVAAAAGVSVMTVSYAFNRPDRVAEDTRGRVNRSATPSTTIRPRGSCPASQRSAPTVS
jgi:hypothetical protein